MGTNTFSCTRKIEIDMAHRVPDHQSKCQNVHGHRYIIKASCTGKLAKEGEQSGMVVDFGFLKDLMMDKIHNLFDHGLCLQTSDVLVIERVLMTTPSLQPRNMKYVAGPIDPAYLQVGFKKLYLMKDTPTAENLARLWFNMLKEPVQTLSEQRAKLVEVEVYETPNCVAAYWD